MTYVWSVSLWAKASSCCQKPFACQSRLAIVLQALLYHVESFLVQVRNRRVQNFGGLIKQGTLVQTALPRRVIAHWPAFQQNVSSVRRLWDDILKAVTHAPLTVQECKSRWLSSIIRQIESQTGVFGDESPNHVLLNAYNDGGGIYDHQDGPIYSPKACILSIGGSTVIEFRRRLPEGESRLTKTWLYFRQRCALWASFHLSNMHIPKSNNSRRMLTEGEGSGPLCETCKQAGGI